MRLLLTGLTYILYLYIQPANSSVEITNIKYGSMDKKFADFEYCYLKSINRTYKYLSLKVNLFKVPVYNVSVSIEMKKRANGYKPFLFNFTMDGCKFLRNRKTNPVFTYFYGFIEKTSNMNHTCPFDHDLIVDKADVGMIDNRVTNILPFPDGEYGLYSKWSAYNKHVGMIDNRITKILPFSEGEYGATYHMDCL